MSIPPGVDEGMQIRLSGEGEAGLRGGPPGNLYVVDQGNNQIRKITPAGAVTTLAGSVLQPGSADGTGTNASFNSPRGIAVVNGTNLFVADTFNNTIRKMALVGTSWVVTTFAGQAQPTGSGELFGECSLLCETLFLDGGVTLCQDLIIAQQCVQLAIKEAIFPDQAEIQAQRAA